ncbi:MAG TPA: hypothetical protein VGJ84_21170, partial [Polyangiaceae bacterium]
MSSPSTGPQPWTSEPDLGASAENLGVITEASTGTQKAGSEPNAGLPRSGQAGSPEATRARAGAMALVGVEPLFPGLVQAFVLFFLEAMSVALGLWSLLHFDALRAYLTQNQLPRAARNVLLMQMIGAGVGVCAVAGVWLAWRGFEKTRSLKAGAWRWSPLIVAGGLPMLFHWQFWSDRPLVFLALAAAVVLGLRRLLAASMSVSAEIPGFLRELAEAWVVMARKHVSRRWRRALPTAVAFAAAAGYSVYFAHHTIVNHFRLGTSAFDLALEDNLVW